MEVTLKREAKGFQNKDKKYELSALLNVDSFFYGLYDYGSKLVYANEIGSIGMLTDEIWQGKALLRKTKIGFLNSLVVIIPESEFQMADITSIVKMSCNLSDTSEYNVRSDNLMKYGLRVCYAVPKAFVHILNETFDRPVLSHYVSAFIDLIPAITLDAIYLDYSGNVLTVVACKEEQFQLINTYEVEEEINAFYWISHIHQTVFGEDNSVPIFYSGKDIGSSSLLANMKLYFPQVNKMSSKTTFEGEPMDDEEAYYPLQCISEL